MICHIAINFNDKTNAVSLGDNNNQVRFLSFLNTCVLWDNMYGCIYQ